MFQEQLRLSTCCTAWVKSALLAFVFLWLAQKMMKPQELKMELKRSELFQACRLQTLDQIEMLPLAVRCLRWPAQLGSVKERRLWF
jgi:hypothetical protein